MLNGVAIAGSVACLAELGIPDLLERGTESAAELATQIAANAQALYCLMRALRIFPGGRERSEAQFRELFAAAGRLARIIPTAVSESIVEGVPV